MALNSNKAPPTRQRIRTLRPWHLVAHEMDNGQVIGMDRRVVAKGEVLDVSIELARQLIVALKAEAVSDTTPLGVPPAPAETPAKKAA